jgi:glycerophosphoryl diester phosphodiesterase
MSSLLCIAHRGGPIIGNQISPENSLEAIQRSLELGVDAIEIDIWQIDGELLVTHDRRLGRQLKGDGLLTQQPPGKLRQLTLENGETVPALLQVLELVKDRALLNIEIKGANCVPLLVDTLISFSKEKQVALDQYIVSSFDHQQLFQMLRRAPEIKRGVLIEGIPLDYAQCCDALQAYSFNTHLSFLNQELIDDARRRGLKNWVYTVNHADDWQWMLELGVDGVFTDKPAELMDFIARGN